MPNLQYIGARYVPVVFDNPDDHSSNWKSGVSYENLVIVTYLDDSYTSRKPVPSSVGDPASNPDYWAKTGDFNASLSALEARVTDTENDITVIKDAYINALDLGFKNDNLTDNATLFNSIMNDDYDGKTIYFPAGTYVINGTVSVTKFIKIVGDPGTTFKEVGSVNYMFEYDFSAVSYYQRSKGNLIEHIIFDCASLSSGIKLAHTLDFGILDCAVNYATVYGIEIDNSSQVNILNCRFYNNANSNTATAIHDLVGDNQIQLTNVVGYQTAFEGRGNVSGLHHWLTNSSNFSGSATLRAIGGIFSDIYCDTCEALLVPKLNPGDNDYRPISITNAQINKNTGVTTDPSYAIKYGALTSACVNISGLNIIDATCYVVDSIPSFTKLEGLDVFSPSAPYTNFMGGQLKGNQILGTTNGTRDCDTEINTGVYASSNSHPIANLPSSVLNGILVVFNTSSHGGHQIYFETRSSSFTESYVYHRDVYNGTGQWRKVKLENI